MIDSQLTVYRNAFDRCVIGDDSISDVTAAKSMSLCCITCIRARLLESLSLLYYLHSGIV